MTLYYVPELNSNSRTRHAPAPAQINGNTDTGKTVTLYSVPVFSRVASRSWSFALSAPAASAGDRARSRGRAGRGSPESRAVGRWSRPRARRRARRTRGRRLDPIGKPSGGPLAQGRDGERASSAREMGARARPAPVLGARHQPRADRIEGDVARGRNQVGFVHPHRAERLEEMPCHPRRALRLAIRRWVSPRARARPSSVSGQG